MKGSGWVLDKIIKLDLHIHKYTPIGGSTFIPLPHKLKIKKAILNVKNKDNKCFLWGVLSHLFKAKSNHDRVNK